MLNISVKANTTILVYFPAGHAATAARHRPSRHTSRPRRDSDEETSASDHE